jgi:hypothetical protein
LRNLLLLGFVSLFQLGCTRSSDPLSGLSETERKVAELHAKAVCQMQPKGTPGKFPDQPDGQEWQEMTEGTVALSRLNDAQMARVVEAGGAIARKRGCIPPK